MPLDSAIAQALSYACTKLRERVNQAAANEALVQLPGEVTALFRLPQRTDAALLKELFKCVVHTRKEHSWATKLQEAARLTNPRAGAPGTQLGTHELTRARLEAHREQPGPASPTSAAAAAANYKAAQREAKAAKKAEKAQRESGHHPRFHHAIENEYDEAQHMIDDAAAAEEEEDVLIYEQYQPKFVGGKPHPDVIVETASLASTSMPQPTYQHRLQELEESGELSNAQLELVVYANMRFNTQVEDGATAGFFLGDGAGVGKGRQIAALILEHQRGGGKRTLWVSVSNDLRYDAARDLADVKAGHISVWPESHAQPLPKGNLAAHFRSGVLFVTYSLLVAGARAMAWEDGPRGGRRGRAAAEDAAVGAQIPANSRLAQIVQWLAGDERPLIILDECHKAKNLVPTGGGKPTQTGRAIFKLQLNLPRAKVLYSSATGASEPNNLAYMTRLGAAGFESTAALVKELNSSGLGALEMFSMGLKATGCYVSRSLSYRGAEFQIAKIKMDPVFRVMYDRATAFWHLLLSVLRSTGGRGAGRARRVGMMQFWAAQQRFFRQMLMAAKVPETAKLALEAVANGMCVVIGMQSTGESNMNQAVKAADGDAMEDFVSAPRQVLHNFLCNHFPTSAGELTEGELLALQSQVRVSINGWMRMLPAKEAAEQEARRQQRQPAAGSSSSGSGAAAADGSASDDEPVIAEELSLDEVIERQREEAKRSGRFIDLTCGDAAAAAEAAQESAAIRAEEAAARRAAADGAAAAEQAARNRLTSDEEEAEAAAARASSELAGLRAELQALERQQEGAYAGGSDGEPAVGQKRLRRASGRSLAAAAAAAAAAGSDLSEGEAEGGARAARRKRGAHLLSDSEEDASVPKAQAGAEQAQQQVEGREPLSQDHVPIGARAPAAAGDSVIVLSDSDSDDDSVVCTDGPPAQQTPANQGVAESGSGGASCSVQTCARLPAQTPAAGGAGGGARAGKPKSRARLVTEIKAAERRLAAATQAAGEARVAAGGRGGRTRGGRAVRPRARVSDSASEDDAGSDPDFAGATSASDSERESGSDSDSGASLSPARRGGKRPAGGDRKPAVGGATERKPSVRKAPEYTHSTARTVLNEDWEEEAAAEAEAGRQEVDDHPRMLAMRAMLLRVVAALELPANPLDQLTELLGGTEAVAEMTGRKGLLVRDGEDGLIKYQTRCPEEAKKMVNLHEKGLFMDGTKLIAIISEAASTGISLQADKRVANQRRRCHLTLELPWSADKAIQQFGRSHRSNQASAPLYRIVVTECAGEHRFASSAAKRLQSLGALLRGDRRALGAGQDLKEFDCDNAWGKKALKRVFSDIDGHTSAMPGVRTPEVPHHAREPNKPFNTPKAFYDYLKPQLAQVGMMTVAHSPWTGGVEYSSDDKVTGKVSVWLNRVLALNLIDQDLLFGYFSATHDALIAAAKSRGEFDHGITELKAHSVSIQRQDVIHTDAGSGAQTFHTVLNVNRGLPWADALTYRDEFKAAWADEGHGAPTKAGFYVDRKQYGDKGMPHIVLVNEFKKMWGGGNRHFRVQRPNIASSPPFLEGQLCEYNRVGDKRAQEVWQHWFDLTGNSCIHGSKCARRRRHEECTFGMRVQSMHLISGAVLPVLKTLYHVVQHSNYGRSNDGKKNNPRVKRALLEGGTSLIGMELHPQDLRLFSEALQQLRAGAGPMALDHYD